MSKIIEQQLSYAINRCLFDVHNEVGPGLREECYQQALATRLRLEGIEFLAKPATRQEFHWKGELVDIFEPDFVVAGRVIVELKHLETGFAKQHDTQILTYLKHWQLPLGLLVNFGLDKVCIRRLPYSIRATVLTEDYSHLPDSLPVPMQQVLDGACGVLREIHANFGAGYPRSTYRNLLLAGLKHAGMECPLVVEVIPQFRGQPLPASRISPIVVCDCVCIDIEALVSAISARAIRTMQTHLGLTHCGAGILACSGKTEFAIRGVRPRNRNGDC